MSFFFHAHSCEFARVLQTPAQAANLNKNLDLLRERLRETRDENAALMREIAVFHSELQTVASHACVPALLD